MKKQEIGGGRLGGGTRLSVEMHNYERSTHDLGYIWRSSMAPGTLVPFMCEVALPGDTFDISLQASVLTHPTLGPLFGSFKLQLDVFEAPVRLYQPALMQNTTAIGNNMAAILLPQIQNNAIPASTITTTNNQNPDNLQINPSALLSYLGIRGWGNNTLAGVNTRNFNGVAYLAYWEIYKNYYANKQELNGAYLLPASAGNNAVTGVTVNTIAIPQGGTSGGQQTTANTQVVITFTSGFPPDLTQFLFITSVGNVTASNLAGWTVTATTATSAAGTVYSGIWIYGWQYAKTGQIPVVTTFLLTDIDQQKNLILQQNPLVQFVINQTAIAPYGPPLASANSTASQCGLGLKTYQSDLFNNWMNTTWFNTITTTTQVSTAGNVFTIDSLLLARKVYDLLNRIMVTGGTYNDWISAAYGHEPMSICMSPIYHGGLSKEVTFQEVVSMAQNTGGNQPLGTLAGRGTMTKKHKGGKIIIKVNEPSYIIGIVSLTPRLDYSQGNKWDVRLNTMNDFHKPAMDQIGFQDLICEQMAWWSTLSTVSGTWNYEAAGKQPAWLNYMTNVNQCRGNFADPANEMFMTLNRRYQATTGGNISDLTTYIDPSHYNFIFAQTSLDAQNFWTQIAVDITARRKMSAKIMPNL